MKCQLCSRNKATLMWFVLQVCEDCYKKMRLREEQNQEEAQKLKK